MSRLFALVMCSVATFVLTATSNFSCIHRSQDQTNGVSCTLTKAEYSCCAYTVQSFSTRAAKLSSSVSYNSSGPNLSINYTFDIPRTLLVSIGEDLCWMIEVPRNASSPVSLTLHPLPRTDLLPPVVQIQRPIHEIFICGENGGKDCKIMNKTSYVLIPDRFKKSVSLIMETPDETDLVYQLMQGDCEIDCSGAPNDCHVETVHGCLSTKKKTGLDGAAAEKHFQSLTPAFYCARIGPPNQCCLFHTETVQLTDANYNGIVKEVINKFSNELIMVVLAFAGCSCLLVTFLVLGYASKLTGKCSPYSALHLPTETDKHDETSCRTIIATIADSTEIILLYCREKSEEFDNVIKSFQSVLSLHFSQVLDPFSDEEVENVSENIYGWKANLHAQEDIKVIIVETSAAINRMQTDEGLNSPIEDSVDRLFEITLNRIKHTDLSYNYSRIFVVRFSSLENERILENFVPRTRYHLYKKGHFERLIVDLKSKYASVVCRSSFLELDVVSRQFNEETEFFQTVNNYRIRQKNKKKDQNVLSNPSKE